MYVDTDNWMLCMLCMRMTKLTTCQRALERPRTPGAQFFGALLFVECSTLSRARLDIFKATPLESAPRPFRFAGLELVLGTRFHRLFRIGHAPLARKRVSLQLQVSCLVEF